MTRSAINAFEATVIAVEDLSPSFRRVTFGGSGLEGFGPNTYPRDLRIKLVIPPREAIAPQFDLPRFLAEQNDAGVSWYQAWLQLDPEVRGSMRTYTVREWRDEARELVVDMIVHAETDGHSGPAGRWAHNVKVGHRLHILGPSRYSEAPCAGIEFEPGGARQILLAGDETAVPAIASIFDSLKGTDATGTAILEVPCAEDFLSLEAPAGFDIQWLARGDDDFGQKLEPAVREAVHRDAVHRDASVYANAAKVPALSTTGAQASSSAAVELDEVDIDRQILWDVPASLSEAAVDSSSDTAVEDRPFYAWIAGEAGPVKRLRRYLVREVGVDRRQIAFMGYWRLGKAEG